MSNELREIQDTIQTRLSDLTEEETTVKARLLQVQQEKTELQGATDRFELFRTSKRKRTIDDCMWCFVFHNRESKMAPQDSDVGDIDIFRCRECGREIEIRA